MRVRHRHHGGVRVLHVIAADRWTGAAATALQAVEALRDVGVDCHFAFRGGHNLAARLADRPWAHPVLTKITSPAHLAAAVRVVRRLARDAQLVHVHLPQDHLLARLAGSRAMVRSIHHPGHTGNPYYRLLLRGVGGIGLAYGDMAETLPRTIRATVPHLPLPVAVEPRFRPGDGSAVRSRLGVPADAVLVGTIGKLDAGRGHAEVVAAVARCPRAWGMVIGKGPYAPRLAALAHELGAASRIVFPGYVEEGLESLYAAMDLFVFPAAGSDWAHRAIAEAAGCGVPTLAADLPGVRDLVAPGVTGDLFPPGDVDALAALLRSWSADAPLRRAAGAAARARAEREWTARRLADACLTLYRAAVPPS